MTATREEVALRPMELADCERLVAWANDPGVPARLCSPVGLTVEGARALVRDDDVDDDTPGTRVFFISASGLGDVGYVTARWMQGNAPSGPPIYELGVVVGDPRHRGRGFAASALRQLVRRVFDRTTCVRTQATVDPDNRAIRAVLERLGFQLEGRLRAHTLRGGELRDECVYSLLRSDLANEPTAREERT